MKNWRTLYGFSSLLAISACSTESTTNVQSFVYENFLGEGRPEFAATSHQIELRSSPSNASSISSAKVVSSKQALPFDNAVTITVKAGRVRMLANKTVGLRNFGEIKQLTREMYYDDSIAWADKTLTLTSEPILLMWLSEGNCLIKIKRMVYESNECPTQMSKQWVLLNQAKTESWIRLEVNASKGWVKIDDPQIKEVTRNF